MITYEVFRSLADPVRSAIVALLAASERSVNDLAKHFAVSRPAVSRHLRVLRAAGVVSHRRSGRSRIYRLETEAVASAAGWLERVLAGSDLDGGTAAGAPSFDGPPLGPSAGGDAFDPDTGSGPEPEVGPEPGPRRSPEPRGGDWRQW